MRAAEEKIRNLLKNAGSYVDRGNLQKAGEKLHRAMEIAEDAGNKELVDKIREFINKFTYNTKMQSVELSHMPVEGFILDIGGGGEGIIGRLYGKQVIAVDTSERELKETKNEALKVVMDATDMKFLAESFETCTCFFSLMYIPKNKHLKVFREVHRVLKNNGRFLVWDVKIPVRFGGYRAFMVRLKVRMPSEEIEAGYGVKWQRQDIEHFRKTANRAKFKVVNELSKDEIFFLDLAKV